MNRKNNLNNTSRRKLITTIGAAATVGLAGCNTSSPDENTSEPSETDTDSDGTNSTEQDVEEEETETENNPDPELSGKQIHDEWIQGRTEEEQLLAQDNDDIKLKELKTKLENSNSRNEGVAQAVRTASEQFRPDHYENRHRHIINAVDTAINEIDDEMWGFDLLSNMNYTQTAGETMQYTELIVPQNGNDYTDIEIVNAAIKYARGGGHQADHGSATHIPGEEVENPGENIYKQTMNAARNPELSGVTPPQDVEGVESRIKYITEERGEEVEEERIFGSFASLMGYQLFSGGHEVNSGFEYRPDQDLIPENKEVHRLINEEKYEKGDMSLNFAINEEYFNNGYDEVEGPVTIDVKEEENDWEITLEEKPGYDWEQGYPSSV